MQDLLRAESDWEYSPQGLHWSDDGRRLLFTADVRSRRALCSVDAVSGGRPTVLCADHSQTLYGECGGAGQLLVGVESFTLPQEIFSVAADGTLKRWEAEENVPQRALSLGAPL